ncbi:MAG: hypothetical protein K8I82_04585 [Anaerolineae bacterium]|nr:hypothetical protein [Anaerolineae bacterium]
MQRNCEYSIHSMPATPVPNAPRIPCDLSQIRDWQQVISISKASLCQIDDAKSQTDHARYKPFQTWQTVASLTVPEGYLPYSITISSTIDELGWEDIITWGLFSGSDRIPGLPHWAGLLNREKTIYLVGKTVPSRNIALKAYINDTTYYAGGANPLVSNVVARAELDLICLADRKGCL